MKDRVPLKPGRVKITPEGGGAAYYATMERADQPTQEGDPLNKATLLADATAALFGLGTDAVPDDVLAYVGKYAQHWWRKYKATIIEKLVQENDIVKLYENYYSGSVNLKYSTSIGFDGSGNPYLVSPSSMLLNSTNIFKSETQSLFKGKYVSGALNRENDVFLLSSSENPFNGSSSGTGGFINRSAVSLVTSDIKLEDDFVYAQSSSKTTYPENGVKDGYYYQYIGIPFDNAATAPKIATGSYVGTGKYGSSNPNSLTFDFEPKLVIIARAAGGISESAWPAYISGLFFPYAMSANYSEYGYGYISINSGYLVADERSFAKVSGNVMTWYDKDAEKQFNESNATYKYISIG